MKIMKCRVLLTLALAFAIGAAVPAAGDDPLLGAASAGKIRAVKALLAACADENLPSTAGAKEIADWLGTCLSLDLDLALHGAAARGHAEIATLLLASGADVHDRDVERETPLHVAANYNSDAAIIEVLLAAGADPNARNRYGGTPLHVAARSGGPAVVKALLAAGADANARLGEDADGSTPLHLAVSTVFASRAAVVESLLAAGADPNAEDALGNTPLSKAHWARRVFSLDSAEERRRIDQVIEILEAVTDAR